MQMSFTGERYVPELRGQIYYEHFHRYAMVLELARDKDVLDIACGEGYGTAALALVARTAMGVDLDPESVRHAAAKYMAMNVGFRIGDCTAIPATDASFDLAVSFETIEHLTEQERMLGELKRVLRPNGVLVISSPNKLVYSDGRSSQNPFHQRELYFDEFRDMLRSFFPKVRIFGQRVFAASAVHPLRGAADETRWLGPSTVAEGTLGALPDPEYFVAICGSAESDELPDLCSVYLDPRDELLADIRSGGLATALNGGGQTALDVPVRTGVLTSGAAESGDAAEYRVTALQADLAKAERDFAERMIQVRSLEDHAAGLETMLGTEQRRTSELAARIESITAELAHKRETVDIIEAERQQESRSFVARIARLTQERDDAIELEAKLRQEIRSLAARAAELTDERDAAALLATQHQQENASLAGRVVELSRRCDDALGMAASRLEENDTYAARVAELQRERDSALGLAQRCQEERDAFAASVAHFEQSGYEADERRQTLEQGFELLAEERDELEAALGRMRRASEEMRDERARFERQTAGLSLERDSLREALSEQQRRQHVELRRLEERQLTAVAEVELELATVREENQQLSSRIEELTGIAARRADLEAEEVRREIDRLGAQLRLERLNYDDLAQRAHQAESVLAEVLSSTSWRVTLPARRFMGVLRRRNKP